MAWKKRFKAAKISTVIGKGTLLKGNLVFTGGIHVDGTIQGNIVAEENDQATLILSEQGLVEGDVKVPNVILNGKVVGDVISSQRVELANNARVTGTLYYRLLEMAMGAEVNGQLIYTEEAEPKMLEFDGRAEPENSGKKEEQEQAVDPFGA